jgi:hypothetical protein
MKNLLLALFLLFSLGSIAEEISCDQLLSQNASKEELAQQGCCSHHGGVCGCSGGRAACCDGALSPSCGCHADDTVQKFLEQDNEVKS